MKTKILSLVALLSVALFSCQKSDLTLSASQEEALLKSTEVSLNDTWVESTSEKSCYEADYFSNSENLLRIIANGSGRLGKFINFDKGYHYLRGHGPDVTIDTASTGYPITITLEYGDSTVLSHGSVLSGTIEIVITGPKFTDGTTRTITYKDFSVDSIAIEGTIVEAFTRDTTTTISTSVNGDLTFTLPNGTVIERISQRVRNWVEGVNTPLDPEDDRIEITGNVTVNSSTGELYVKEIIEPLIRLGACEYYVQGIARITQDGEMISEIDYGDGTCDNTATVTAADGTTTEITLHEGGGKPTNNGKHGANSHSSNGKGKH